MRPGLHLLALAALIWISGCTAEQIEKATLEDLAMVGVMGFDMAEEDSMYVTITAPQPSEDAKRKTMIMTQQVHMVHAALVKMSAHSERELSTAQLRVVLISEELAKRRGIEDIIEHMYRDPSVGDNVYLAIVKGSVKEMLSQDYPDRPSISDYLNNLLHPRVSTAFSPFTTIHDFIYDLTNETNDPIAPYIEVQEGNIAITRIALFKREKMIDSISPEEAKIVQGLQNVVQIPSFMLTIKENRAKPERILVNFVKTKFQETSTGSFDRPKLRLDLKVTGSVMEYTGDKNFDQPSEVEELTSSVERELQEQTDELIKKFKQLGVDPIGLSKAFRRQHRGEWSKQLGLEMLESADIDIRVQMNLINTGTLE